MLVACAIVDLLPRDSKAERYVGGPGAAYSNRRTAIFLRNGRAEPGAGFRGHVGGTTLATTAPSNLPNYDPTAESWSSIRICVRPNPAPMVFSPEPPDRLAARRRFYHGAPASAKNMTPA